MSANLDDFLVLSDEILGNFREQRGMSDTDFLSILKSLTGLEILYKNQNTLPKELVGVLVDLPTALYSASDAYDEPMRTKLFQQFNELQDKIRDLCL
jgi:hypothetical protein